MNKNIPINSTEPRENENTAIIASLENNTGVEAEKVLSLDYFGTLRTAIKKQTIKNASQ